MSEERNGGGIGCVGIIICVVIGLFLFKACDVAEADFYVPLNEVYAKAESSAPTHYHENVGCPALREEQSDATQIIRCERNDIGGSKLMEREGQKREFKRTACPLCVKIK